MLFGLGSKKRKESEARLSTDGRLIYAIGDVHGRLDLLEDLLRRIADDIAVSKSAQRPVLIFLGDYVDRGAFSKGVIDCVIKLKALGDIEVRALKGNHEQSLLGFLTDPQVGPGWFQHGGAATLVSYGVAAPQTHNATEIWEQASEAFAKVLPAEHLKFYRELEISAEYGDYIFVHAGLRPGVPIEQQTEQDMLWIRAEFLEERRPFGKVVVHGHSPEPEPFLSKVRLGLDTGAYATGILTAARLFDGACTFIQATAHGDPLVAKAS